MNEFLRRSFLLAGLFLFQDLLVIAADDVKEDAAVRLSAGSSALNPPSVTADAGGKMSMEEIGNPEFLRSVAQTIFSRHREQVRLKEKLIKHGQMMIDVWRSGKKWGELEPRLQGQLTKHLPKSQVQSILRRERHSVMIPPIIEHPERISRLIIEKGMPTLRVLGEQGDRYGIKISLDMKPEVMGSVFLKTDKDIQETPETKIYISFDVTDIVRKINMGGEGSWNKESDGEITTLCVDE